MQPRSGRRLRAVNIAAQDVVVTTRGEFTYVRAAELLAPYAEKLTERLHHWAEETPDRTFLAEREPERWRELSYAETLSRVRRLARSLLARGLSRARPVAILSGNSIDHACLGLAAMYAGIPYSPISPAYSLLSREHDALRHILGVFKPGLVFAADERRFELALRHTLGADVELVVATSPPAGFRATRLSELEELADSAEVDAAHGRVGPDTIAKVLFTSGSTGRPKGVINTQRMLCANQSMIRTLLVFLTEEPPVLCDWLPWNHTFGGNHNFGCTLYNGGTLYIDEGRPTTEGFDTTARNLRDVAPTAYFNVPKGYDLLVTRLRADAALRERFFSRVKLLFFAAAGLSQSTWDALQDLAVETCGEEILMITGLGSTETAPAAIFTGRNGAASGWIGLPLAGVEVKLAPAAGKLEARVRGPNVTPGYWNDVALTMATRDDEGFFKMGDGVRWVDPANHGHGLLFDGRLNEDFKLSSGTWVSYGPLRAKLLMHLAPLAQDVVIVGPDRAFLGALIFPNVEACRVACSDAGARLSVRDVLDDASVRTQIRARLEDFARHHPAESTHVVRALLLDEPPTIDGGELTDKGSLNQKAVMARRAGDVEALYMPATSPRVIALHDMTAPAQHW